MDRVALSTPDAEHFFGVLTEQDVLFIDGAGCFLDNLLAGSREATGLQDYREATGLPQEATGFAPFELLYGRNVRGPLAIRKDILIKDSANKMKDVCSYVQDLNQKLN